MMFASRTLIEHAIRGVLGVGALTLAIKLSPEEAGAGPVLPLVLALGALVAFRGCPMCWTIGLFSTIRERIART